MSAFTHNLWALDAQLPPIAVRPLYVKLCGSWTTAAFLAQIMYWSRPAKNGDTKLRIQREEHLWIAKTRDEWMSECQLSAWELRNALASLKDLGVIEVKTMRFGGRTISHLRLLPDKLFVSLAEGMLNNSGGRNSPSQYGGFLPPPPQCMEDSSKPYTESTFTETTPESTGDASLATPTQPGDKHLETLKEEEVGLDEVLKKFGEKKSTKTLESMDIFSVWRSTCAEQYKEQYQAVLTMKQHGQLKKFEKDLGEYAKPTLRWVICNWWAFAQHVKVAAGLETIPAQAINQIGFVLAHRQHAVDLYLQSIAPASEIKVQTPVLAEVPQVQSQELEEPAFLSPQELDEFLKKIENLNKLKKSQELKE